MKQAMIAVAALAASGTAFAGAHSSGGGSDPDWTFVNARYIQASGFGDEETDGYSLDGSFEFAEKWHVQGSWGTIELDGGTDVDIYTIRVGGHPAVTANTDLVFDIGYTEWDIDGGTTPSAYDVRMGYRTMLSDAVELNGFLTYQSGDTDSGSSDDFDNFAPTLGAQYYWTDNLSVNVAYSWNSTFNAVSGTSDIVDFGVRYNF
jgi:opacity protein-like surface antigen